MTRSAPARTRRSRFQRLIPARRTSSLATALGQLRMLLDLGEKVVANQGPKEKELVVKAKKWIDQIKPRQNGKNVSMNLHIQGNDALDALDGLLKLQGLAGWNFGQ